MEERGGKRDGEGKERKGKEKGREGKERGRKQTPPNDIKKEEERRSIRLCVVERRSEDQLLYLAKDRR